MGLTTRRSTIHTHHLQLLHFIPIFMVKPSLWIW